MLHLEKRKQKINTMKKYILVAALCFVTVMHGQHVTEEHTNNGDISELIDQGENYGLSAQQREKLIERKKRIGREYAAIGRDRSLTGYEKGIKKRELSMQIERDIRAILYEEQYIQWSNYNRTKYKGQYREFDYTNDDIKSKIDSLEEEYERDIKQLEQKYRSDKYQLKREKNNRKALYKRQKQELKNQKL